jgi:hypothetical protein
MALWAYLDPDSGSMLLQMLAGGLAGLGVLVRYQWRVLSSAVMSWTARFRTREVPAGDRGGDVA